MNALVGPVESAIAELRESFAPADLTWEPDGHGGARVLIEPVPLGPPYEQGASWIGGHLPAQLPYADVYPLFVRGDLQRLDRKALGAGLTGGHTYMARSAVQVSRRSNGINFEMQTAAMKFMKVLHWLRQAR